MATFNKFNQFVGDLAAGVHNLGTNSLMVALYNTAPTSSNATYGSLTGEVAAGSGYTTGGLAATTSASSQTSGTYKLVLADLVFTSTGTLGPFRYVVLYNATPTSPLKPLIGYWDYGSSITLASAETFTVDFDQVAGVLTLA
jgi:hypothetical protein